MKTKFPVLLHKQYLIYTPPALISNMTTFFPPIPSVTRSTNISTWTSLNVIYSTCTKIQHFCFRYSNLACVWICHLILAQVKAQNSELMLIDQRSIVMCGKYLVISLRSGGSSSTIIQAAVAKANILFYKHKILNSKTSLSQRHGYSLYTAYGTGSVTVMVLNHFATKITKTILHTNFHFQGF